jgi:hypothetical protein
LELVVVSAKLTSPLPVTADVTSKSTHVPFVVAPAEASELPAIAGALAQVRPVSVQPLATLKTLPPSGLSSVTNSRSFADVGAPPRPLTSNFR